MFSKQVLTIDRYHPDYPQPLLKLARPPEKLYFVGQPLSKILNKPIIAIVGSRKVSDYGRLVTEQLTQYLAERGVVVISGLALGVDSIAHRSCLAAKSPTVAVLPGPLDKIYPSSHTALAKQIVANGCLISELGSGQPIYRSNFVTRSRIIVGLADAVIVTEAALKSGSLHTAKLAQKLKKPLGAVPGNINSLGSIGCNQLIKEGAQIITDRQDALKLLSDSLGQRLQVELPLKATESGPATPGQKLIIELLSHKPLTASQLGRLCNLSPATVNELLVELEIEAKITQSSSGHWSLWPN